MTFIIAAALTFAMALAHAQIIEPGGRLTIGYYGDAKPFSYENESGKPVGYAVELCQKVVELAKVEAGLKDERIAWIRVSAENRLALLREKKIRVLCGEAVTLADRKDVSFSIPIFQGGVGALVRADAPPALLQTLSGKPDPALQAQTLAVVGNSPTENVVADQLAKLGLAATVAPMKDYAQGVQAVLDRKADVFFADRSVLLDAVRRNASFENLKVMDRRFSAAPVAIALARGNEDARLAVDRALSRIYATDGFRAAYVKWFGEPDADTLAFFRLSVLPE
jgi:putrescine:ornithine antiporter